MQITVLQENIQHALNYIQKAIPSKPQLPILSSILITVTDSSCTLGATDLYFGVRATMPVQVKEVGTVAVPGKEFREIIGSLPAGEVQLSFKDATLTIIAAHTKCSLQCQNASEYPPFPQVTGDVAVIQKLDIERMSDVVLYSASNDQARPLLTGVLFDFKPETMRMVTTDGFRLSVYDCAPVAEQQAVSFILPVRAVGEVCRIASQLNSEQVTFTVSESLKQVFITFDTIEIYARILEGDYPPYEKIIPSLFTTEVFVQGDELLEQVKRATIFSRDSSSIVQFEVTKDTLKVTASSSTLGTFAGETATAKIAGDDVTIAFKSRYLLDFLQAAGQSEIWIGMTSSVKPALFQTKELAGYRYIVMPFRVTT